MSDWKARLDKIHGDISRRRDEEIRQRQEKERGRGYEDSVSMNRRLEREAEESWQGNRNYEIRQNIDRFQRKFKCHVCRKAASRPREEPDQAEIDRRDYADYNPVSRGNTPLTVLDWNTPDDLYRCNRCKRYFCSDHIHSGLGYCERCARRKFG